MRKTGNAKAKRDRMIRRFAQKHPEYTEKELGVKYGLSQAAISEILSPDRGRDGRQKEREMKLCESCALSGIETEATTRSINPDFAGYLLCEECAREYDSRPHVVDESSNEDS